MENDDAQTTLPFFLGSTKTEVLRSFGEPNRAGAIGEKEFASYAKHGVVVDYVNERIVEISGSRVEIGDVSGKFSGRLFGLALYDSIEDHRERLGPELEREDDGRGSLFLTWQFEGFYLLVEVWSEDGFDEDYGHYRAGEVSEICVKQKILTEDEQREAAAGLIQEMYPDLSPDEIKDGLAELDENSGKDA